MLFVQLLAVKYNKYLVQQIDLLMGLLVRLKRNQIKLALIDQ